VESLRGEYGSKEHRKEDSWHGQYSSKNIEAGQGSNIRNVTARATYPSTKVMTVAGTTERTSILIFLVITTTPAG